jgi:hypothetical protein
VGFREKWTGQKTKSKEIKPIDEEETYFKQMQTSFLILWCGQIVGARELVPKTSACCAGQLNFSTTARQHS